MNDTVIVSLAMLKLGDKVLELQEHLNYEQQLLEELKVLLEQWAHV